MSSLIMKSHPLLKLMNNSLVDLPSPANISFAWNMGSLLGMTLGLQILTGLFLALHYNNDASAAFASVIRITYEINNGWILRSLHANGASMFFIFLYLHTGRGIYFGSYRFMETWNTGIILLLLTMATAFLGYVLPWGQMSFWGATVITNLLSAVPYAGGELVIWLWGGFAVSSPTLSRFFAFHFLLPFILALMVMIHLMFLHQTGSNNPLGINSNFDKIPFHPYFTIKDILGFLIALILLTNLSLWHPWLLGDPDNFIPANPLSTPPHIQPEWYFLFAYAILRSIPNKLGGVIALLLSVLIPLILPFTNNFKFQSLQFYPLNKILFWVFVNTILLLTWIGARPVEHPFVLIGQLTSCLYFLYFLINPLLHKYWNYLL